MIKPCVTILLMCGFLFLLSERANSTGARIPSVAEYVQGILDAKSMKALSPWIVSAKEVLDEPSAKKVIIELLRKIDSKTPLAFEKAPGDPKMHDLSVMGERSLWVLEQLLECKFPHDRGTLDKSKVYETVIQSMMFPTNLLNRTYEYQLELAKNPKTHRIDLERLASSGSSEILLLVIQNPTTPNHILSALVGYKDMEVNKAVGAKLLERIGRGEFGPVLDPLKDKK